MGGVIKKRKIVCYKKINIVDNWLAENGKSQRVPVKFTCI